MTERPHFSRSRRGGPGPGRPASRPAGGARRTHVEALHPTAEPPDIPTFRHWDLGEPVQAAIAAMNIEVPTPIQRLAIGPVLEGRDVIAKAETGTGKTLAFGAPIVSKLDPARATVLALVLCPTRELAQQVCSTLEVLGAAKGLKTALVVGGEPMQGQVQALQKGAQIVVGTPGRVLDLYGQRFLSFPWTEFVVLDEADEMLEIGFIDDVKKILGFTPDERQTLLFSATFPGELLTLARESTRNPAEIATAAGVATVKTIEQVYMKLDREDRALGLIRLIEQSQPEDVFLVFCDRRTEVDSLMRRLSRLPFSIKALHGGYDQPSRFRVMGAFRTGEVKALVATDVASRGLDVLHVTHVVNYSVPHDVESYTHRIGRTGRAGRSGAAITIVAPESIGRWRDIQNHAPWEIPEIPPPGPGGVRGRPARHHALHENAGADRREPEPAREAPPPERARAEERPHAEERSHRRAPSADGRAHRGERAASGERPHRGERTASVERPHRDAAPAAPEAARERGGREPEHRGTGEQRRAAEPAARHARERDARPPKELEPAPPREKAAREHPARDAGPREDSGSAERPRRTLSTRERLKQEREGGAKPEGGGRHRR